MRHSGQCLCGEVRFNADVSTPEINACHCIQCQRWAGGSPYLSVQVTDVKLEEKNAVSVYHASEWGERGFCKSCGSTLFWRMQDGPITNLAIGLFDDREGWAVTREIFVDHRAGWLPAWQDASQSTESQEFEKLNAALQGEEQ